MSLAIGERHWSDRECLEYEREYRPLHAMADSFVGCQTLILEKRGEELRDFRAGSTPRDEESQLLTQDPTNKLASC